MKHKDIVTAGGAAQQALLLHRYARAVAERPAAIALECATESYTYAQLEAQAVRIGVALQAAGVLPGDRVALQLRPGCAAIVMQLAVLRVGAAYVPLDPASPVERAHAIVEQCRPRLLVIDAPAEPALQAADHACPVISYAALDTPSTGAQGAHSSSVPMADIQPDDIAYIMFTSGSTGEPRGVAVSHGSLAGLFAALPEFKFGGDDCWSTLHSTAFGFSVWEIWGALSHGGRLLVVPEQARAEPAQWDQRLRGAGVNILSLTPSGLRQWLQAGRSPLTGLRLVVLSGEALQADDLRAWFKLHPPGQGPHLVNTYALTETAGRLTTRWLRPDDVADERSLIPSMGYAAPDAELFVCDPETLQPVAAGATGELLAAGPMLATGYWRDPAATAERFIQFDPGDGRLRRCYRTGDLVSRSVDGEFWFQGRRDDQVKLRGHRVELGAIEAAIRRHPEVEQAAVLATPAATGGGQELLAFAVPLANQTADAIEFWPSLGEYQIYDALLYDFMSADAVRVDSYSRAFAQHVNGKVVLDIGTGKDALLARLCVAAGARHVYAVEVLADAAASAAQLVTELGLADSITVICGNIEDITLPEPIEVCTQGIIGNIGSSDGIAPLWNSARRWFTADCVAVPAKCTTFIAPAELPGDARHAPRFGPLAADYARRVFAAEGHEFDVRLCVRNFPATGLLADAAVFEELDFGNALDLDTRGAAEFVIARDAELNGFLLWTRLENAGLPAVDFLEHQQAWLPVWFPLQEGGLQVRASDLVAARWESVTPAGQPFPDYRLEVTVSAPDGTTIQSVYVSRHHETALGQTAIHRKLHAALHAPAEQGGVLTSASLRDFVAAQLPDYMVPPLMHLLPQLPLNVNRKLDRQALLEHVVNARTQVGGAAPQGRLEQVVAEIWCSALGLDVLTREQDFFDLGGDSISAVRVTTEVQRYLDATVFLTALYAAPTVASYSAWLGEHHADAVAERVAAGGGAMLSDGLSGGVMARAAPGPSELSPAQQSLWFLQQLYPENTAANEQFVVRMQGADGVRVRTAWRCLLAKHDILRARFVAEEDALPLQYVDPLPAESTLRELDFASGTANANGNDSCGTAAVALRELAAAEIATPFDLSRGGLVRAVLVTTGSSDQSLIVTAHHIVADGLCIEIVRDELLAAYEAADRGSDALPPAELQFADFVAWQREQLTPDVMAADVQWWHERLADAPLEPLALGDRQPDPTGPQRRVEFVIPASTAVQLRRVARANGASLFMLMSAAWRVWLSRSSGRLDTLIGTPATQRNDAATSSMLGCLVNNIVLRNPLDLTAGFTSLLRAERQAVLSALEHATAPFEYIVAALEPPRVLGRHPVFQAMLQFEDYAVAVDATDGARFATDVLPVDRASYWDIELAVREGAPDAELRGFLGFRTDLFPVDEVTTWPAGLMALFNALAADPEQAVGGLPLLDAQQVALRAQRNSVRFAYPHTSVCELFLAQAQRTPTAAALLQADERLSYGELEERVHRYATGLHRQGVEPGDLIGVQLRSSPDALAALLAINGLGATWVPLDPDYPPGRIAAMVAAARPKLVLCEDAALVDARQSLLLSELANSPAAQNWLEPAPAEHIAVLFTSGSTGVPKGARVSHAAALSRCLWFWDAYGFGQDDVFAHRTSLNFIDSLWELFGPLLHGGSIRFPPPACASDARALASWLSTANATHLVVVPALLTVLLNEWEKRGAPASLALVICSGDSLSRGLADRFAMLLPDCRLVNTYGTSEHWDICAGIVDSAAENARMDVGVPVANSAVHILDAALQPLPNGAVGNLYVSGLAGGASYLNAAARSIGGSVVEPSSGLPLSATGDLASWTATGRVRLHGRSDRQFKLRGVRIEPGEIEALAAQCPQVEAAAVRLFTGDEDDRTTDWLSLYAVAVPGAELHERAVRDWLATRLPRTLLPADIVILASLPVTPSGKLDVAALPRPRREGRNASASSDTEHRLLAIWRDALGNQTLGTNDDFFALRGNSLLATKVIARVCDEFGVDLPLAALFESPTVSGLAQALDAVLWTMRSDGPSSDREVVRL